jgi:3-oxoacyl-[acyl-carrier-protein] synthase II
MDQARSVYAEGGRGSLWTITNATHGNLSGEISIRLGLRGPSWCVSTGCASAMDAMGMAMMRLRAGGEDDDLDGFVVVGADAHVRWETLYGLELLRVISTRAWEDATTASRPFDKSRDGFVLGEGAWAVVIEKARGVEARGETEQSGSGFRVPGLDAHLGEVLGYAATCDAYHRVRPDPEMEESARAMRLAVRDAGLKMEDVDLIHYHGTATRLNDAVESAAVKMAFGAHAAKLRGTSVKSMIGHPQGACGLASLVATLGCLNAPEPFVPPTINLREPDVEGGCDLEYTALRAAKLERRAYVALVNCLAFGAKNSAIVVRGGSDGVTK